MADNQMRCFNCHFLGIGSYAEHRTGKFVEVGENSRSSLAESGVVIVNYGYYYCYHKVWSAEEAADTSIIERQIRVIDRKGSCFFWTYVPNMMPEGAAILQRRAADRDQLARERSLTNRGLEIAAIALTLTALFSLINIIFDILQAYGKLPTP